jgi:hypothetical protein
VKLWRALKRAFAARSETIDLRSYERREMTQAESEQFDRVFAAMDKTFDELGTFWGVANDPGQPSSATKGSSK